MGVLHLQNQVCSLPDTVEEDYSGRNSNLLALLDFFKSVFLDILEEHLEQILKLVFIWFFSLQIQFSQVGSVRCVPTLY